MIANPSMTNLALLYMIKRTVRLAGLELGIHSTLKKMSPSAFPLGGGSTKMTSKPLWLEKDVLWTSLWNLTAPEELTDSWLPMTKKTLSFPDSVKMLKISVSQMIIVEGCLFSIASFQMKPLNV